MFKRLKKWLKKRREFKTRFRQVSSRRYDKDSKAGRKMRKDLACDAKKKK